MAISCRVILLLVPCLLGLVRGVEAQATGVPGPPVAEAQALSAEGRFTAVVRLLRPYVAAHPEDAEGWLLLARHQYWSGEAPAARVTFAEALSRHPEDDGLRLAYARFLVETGAVRAARRVLQPMDHRHAEAETLRGTAAWTEGDLTGALRHFEQALRADPSRVNPTHAEAAAGRAALREGMRPWARLTARGRADSQPLGQREGGVEVGLYATPLQALQVTATRTRLTAGDSLALLTAAALGYRAYWPALRLETSLDAGLLRRPERSFWTAALGLALRLPRGLRLGARAERAPYLFTEASVQEAVMTETLEASLNLGRAGWMAQAAVLREAYPDRNAKTAAFGWLLAPLLRRPAATLQAGYAYSYQHARESRFAPVLAAPPAPGQPPAWTGRYAPYYTPLHLHAHSLTGRLALNVSARWTAEVGGAYGVWGVEDAPYVYADGRVPRTGLYRHVIHPWELRASASVAPHPGLTVRAEALHQRTTWYEVSSLDLTIHLRF